MYQVNAGVVMACKKVKGVVCDLSVQMEKDGPLNFLISFSKIYFWDLGLRFD
jgi:hypothetical protein